MRITALVLTISALLTVSSLMAEVPTWEDFAGRVFVLRQHFPPTIEGSHPYSGVWLFDPSDAEWESVRPLSVAVDEYYGAIGISMATWHDSLLVQRFPTSYEFELPSLRLIRTFSTVPDDSAWGWTLHGPAIDPQEATAIGVDPGHYGFLHCSYMTVPPLEGQGSCAQLGIPAFDDGSLFDQVELVVYRPHDDSSGELDLLADLPEYGGPIDLSFFALTLAPDPLRGGFWRGRRRSLQLLQPTGDGQLMVASERDLPAELFVPNLYSGLGLVHYHQHSDQLLVRTMSHWKRFAAVDPETFEIERLYDSCDECDGLDSNRFPGWMASLAAAPPVEKLQTVPIVVDAPGRNGTHWRTRLWLYNPSARATAVDLRRVTAPELGHTVELDGHGSAVVEDPLALLGGGERGDGATHDAIQVRSEYRFAENVVAVARVWTGGAGGTFGQAVPAVPDDVGYSNHEAPTAERNEFGPEAWVIVDRRQPGQFRHNLGVVNPSDEPLQVVLRWVYHTPGLMEITPYLPDATRQVVDVAPHSVRLVHLESLFPEEIVEGWPSQVSVRASDQAIIWFSMVDNTSGDATFLPYTLRWLYEWEWAESAIPAVAYIPGVGGANWRTDLYGLTWSFDPDNPWVMFHPGVDDVCGGLGPGDEVAQQLRGEMSMPLDDWVDTLVSNDLGRLHNPSRFFRCIFSDVVRIFNDCQQEENVRGALEIPASSWTSMFSRTYVERPDGGTYGGMLPMYPHNGWPVQYFAGIEVSDDFRINLGLYNGNDEHGIVHRLTLNAADGSVAAEAEVTLAPWESDIRPLSSWLGVDSLPDGTYGLTVLPLDEPTENIQGRSWAFVSMIDNRTGDPTNWW